VVLMYQFNNNKLILILKINNDNENIKKIKTKLYYVKIKLKSVRDYAYMNHIMLCQIFTFIMLLTFSAIDGGFKLRKHVGFNELHGAFERMFYLL